MTIKPRPQTFILPVVLLLLFIFTPLAILRYLFAMYLLFFLLAFLYVALVPRLISVERSDETIRTNRFQPFTVRLVLRNRGILPIHLLSAEDTLGGLFSRESGGFVFGLGPYESRTFAYAAESHERGEFTLGPVELKGTDPLGMFQWRRRAAVPLRVIVYPAVHPVPLSTSTGLPAGNVRVTNKIYEDVTNFRSVREYVPGDEMRRVNWKVSARLGRLFVMEYMPSLYFPVLIAANLSDPDFPVSHKQQLFERVIEVAASLVFHFVGIKQEVGLVTTGRLADRSGFPAAPIKAGYGHAVGMLEMLARIGASPEPAGIADVIFRSGITIHTGTKIMVVTPPLRPEQAAALLGVRRKGYDTEVFVVSSYTMRREDITLQGIRSHAVGELGSELFDG